MADTDTADRTLTDVPGGGVGADRAPGNGHGPGPTTGESSGDGTLTGGRPTRSGSKLAYNPALDGIRGLAVGAVLLFHGGYSWARGGYLGVSTFFTLSGFLITSLLVAERVDTGSIALSRFWARRLRRLFPASALTLAGISLSAILLDQGWERALRGDVLGALLQVANWRFLFDDRAYADLFASPSPVLHFWSLAIEEQFYWVFPLLAAGVFGLAKGSLKVFAAVLGGLFALSAVLTLAYGPDDPTVVYYATPIRMGEILVGALLAVGLALGFARAAIVQRVAAAGGVMALAVSAYAWCNVGQDSPRLYEGGLLAYALISGALVLSATVPGPVRAALSFEPLRLLGVISYGVYLFHWPVFLVLDGERTGLGGERLFAVRLAATLAIAIASYYLLEKPIRRGWRPTWPAKVPMPALAGGAFALVVAVAVVVPAVYEPPEDPFAAFAEGGQDPRPESIPPGSKLGLTIGDSTMFRTSWGLGVWGGEMHEFTFVSGTGGLGCSVARGGEIDYSGSVGETKAECNAWAELLPDAITRRQERYGHLDFAFVQYGPWDVADRKLDGSDQWLHPGDEEYDGYLRSEIEKMTDLLLAHGVMVVWATAPHLDVGKLLAERPDGGFPESDPARVDRFNEIVRQVMDAREGAVVVDLQAYLAGLPGGEFDATYVDAEGNEQLLRPDGVHFEVESAIHVADDWLGPAVMQALTSETPPPVPGGTAEGDGTPTAQSG
ncbi:MAG TPA: acyltransferase family protein [Acidimicrobiales bacterium]|nr:acyltransferase family protein [Acidimicrobiales bacterium]